MINADCDGLTWGPLGEPLAGSPQTERDAATISLAWVRND